MLAMKYFLTLLLVVLSLALGSTISAGSRDDSDQDDEEFEYEDAQEPKDKKSRWFVFRRVDVKPVQDPLYLKECGACHFPYQPGLLPSTSWKKLMGGLDNHFGDNASLDEATRTALTAFLVENAAEFCECRKSYKILRSLRGEVPLRITEVPYVSREHREISDKLMQKKNLKSLANCDVCHTEAASGLYDDD